MRSVRLLITAAGAAALLAGPVLAQQAAAPAPAATPAVPSPYRPIAPAGDVLATLQASGEFTIFVKAANATNIATVLKTAPNITVFAPTDAAFLALPAGQLDALLQPTGAAQLRDLVLYHIVNTRLASPQIKGHAATPVTTVGNKPLTIDGTGEAIKANGATVIQADVAATNGLIQVVDGVLSPGWTPPAAAAAPLTTVAPATDPKTPNTPDTSSASGKTKG